MKWLLDTNALIKCHLLSKKKVFKENKSMTTIFSLLEFPLATRHEELSIIYPTQETFQNAMKIALKLRKKGTPVPTIDLLIATMALEREFCLVSDDAHMNLIEDVEPSLKIVNTEKYLNKI